MKSTAHIRIFLFAIYLCCFFAGNLAAQAPEVISLPEPVLASEKSLEELLRKRRSGRDYSTSAIELADISQLLWAAQGITHPRGLRTAPSAGALYPLELYVVAGNVNDLRAGVYHYQVGDRRLKKIRNSDLREQLARAAYGQDWIEDAAAVVVFASAYHRTTRKYGPRGERYVHIEVGHAAQNLFLQAETRGLSTVVVGAFHDEDLAGLLQLPDNVRPLLLMPVGRKGE